MLISQLTTSHISAVLTWLVVLQTLGFYSSRRSDSSGLFVHTHHLMAFLMSPVSVSRRQHSHGTSYSAIYDVESESPVMGKGEGQGAGQPSYTCQPGRCLSSSQKWSVIWVGVNKQFPEFCPHCLPSTAANLCLWPVRITHLKLSPPTSFQACAKQQAERLVDQDQPVLLSAEAFLLAQGCHLFEMSCHSTVPLRDRGRGKERRGT